MNLLILQKRRRWLQGEPDDGREKMSAKRTEEGDDDVRTRTEEEIHHKRVASTESAAGNRVIQPAGSNASSGTMLRW